MARQTRYGVVMGDLVGSSGASDHRRLHTRFNRCIDEANQRFVEILASPLTITLGDEFQGLAKALETAFVIGHSVRVSLLRDGFAIRIAVGTTVLETKLNPDKAWNMMGPGLAEAREKLSDKKDTNCYRFSIPQDEAIELLLAGVGRSLTMIEDAWTQTQVEYVTAILNDPEQPRSSTARNLGISENSLYKVLRSADFRLYSQQLDTIRTALRLYERRRGESGE